MIVKRFLMLLCDGVLSGLYGVLRNANRRCRERESLRTIARLGRCGRGVHIYAPANITGHEHIAIGDNVHIADNCRIRGEGGLSIGNNTHISRNLVLYTVNHRYEGERLPYDDQLSRKAVAIGRNVWIGMNVCIAPGSTIGDGAIIGMGTTISGNVPPLAIVGGASWRILKYRDEESYRRLEQAGRYGGVNGAALEEDCS